MRQTRIVIRRDAGGTLPRMPTGSSRFAAALAAVMAISPLLGTLHDASVRHFACPEDGELVEAPAQRAHAHEQAGAQRALFPEAPVAPSAPGAEHDHCVIASQLRGNSGVAVSPSTAGSFSGLVSRPAKLPERPAAPGLALYRLVPKASPPA